MNRIQLAHRRDQLEGDAALAGGQKAQGGGGNSRQVEFGPRVGQSLAGRESHALRVEAVERANSLGQVAGDLHPFIAEGGSTVQTLGFSPEDTQLLASRGFGVEEVCRFFGVPPHMAGHTEKSTSWGTGLKDQTEGFVKFALRKRLKRIEQAIMKQLLTPADRAAGIVVEFNLEGLLRGDSEGRAAFYESGLRNGWTTINEVRRRSSAPLKSPA